MIELIHYHIERLFVKKPPTKVSLYRKIGLMVINTPYTHTSPISYQINQNFSGSWGVSMSHDTGFMFLESFENEGDIVRAIVESLYSSNPALIPPMLLLKDIDAKKAAFHCSHNLGILSKFWVPESVQMELFCLVGKKITVYLQNLCPMVEDLVGRSMELRKAGMFR